ncbi:hypothetical protein DP939_24400 [Spongiactinospora rosea]|uniref:Uncharacterized protein n=1 Tax=Spongiactinospora rosea TaxID=2248750 RepID=A0A366LV46_9ACTN|nr:hypothetical protein DP939_24400 [Spongiactinospora rosea]
MDGLWREQKALQAAADAVYADLGLAAALAEIGTPTRVGSAALGVMVARDLDIDVACAALDDRTFAGVARLGADLVRHPRVRQVQVRDDTGVWNVDPLYPDGLYLGVRYRCPDGNDWTLDIWFVDEPERQPSTVHLGTIRPRLTDERRVAILRIKRGLAARGGPRVSGYDIYVAVLDEGVRTLDDFDRRLSGS